MAKKPKSKKKPIKRAVLKVAKVKRKKAKKPWTAPRQVTIPDEGPVTMTETEIETERKLSVKIIVGKRIDRVEVATPLFTVIGIATGTRTGQSTYGEWVGLRGQFEVTRFEDGKVMRAPIIILPDVALAVITEAARHWPLSFALEVGVKPIESDPGFEHTVKVLDPPVEHDPLAELRRLVAIHE